jgi:endoglucanase
LLLAGCGPGANAPSPSPAPGANTPLVHVENEGLVGTDGEPLLLRGVTFGDWWFEGPDPNTFDHDGTDYARVAAMGMNEVLLLFNYQILEDDAAPFTYKQSGLDWLDQNVAWAKANGLYLVPVLSTVPGGDTGDCGNDAFWEGPEYQDRFVALWRTLAARYALEPTIAGYGLLQGPNPDQSLEQWQALGNRVIGEIRKVDSDHLLLVDAASSIACNFTLSVAQSLTLFDDHNVLYDFATFQPWNYTAQLLASTGLPDDGAYPGAEQINPDWSNATWLHASWDSRPDAESLYLPAGDTDWSEEHFYYTVTDKSFRIAQPNLQSDYNTGTIYFDDIVINEYDENANFVRVVANIDLESLDGEYLYEGDASGNPVQGTTVVALADDAHRGKHSVSMSGATTQVNLGLLTQGFPVQLGHTYELTGWMKGKHSAPSGASMIRIDFYAYTGDLGVLDKEELGAQLDPYVAWQQANKVPLNLSGFGTGVPTFANDRGGLVWVNDMIDLLVERNLHFTYYTYHSDEWGIYSNSNRDALPDPNAINQPLVDLFTAKLH